MRATTLNKDKRTIVCIVRSLPGIGWLPSCGESSLSWIVFNKSSLSFDFSSSDKPVIESSIPRSCSVVGSFSSKLEPTSGGSTASLEPASGATLAALSEFASATAKRPLASIIHILIGNIIWLYWWISMIISRCVRFPHRLDNDIFTRHRRLIEKTDNHQMLVHLENLKSLFRNKRSKYHCLCFPIRLTRPLYWKIVSELLVIMFEL